MTFKYTNISLENLPAVRELIMRFWERDWDTQYADRFLTWRYLERQGGDPIVAVDGTRCIAILDSWIRPYRLAGRTVHVREICDWFCLPQYRPLGLNLLQMVMRRPEPILSVAGNIETTLQILPRVGFRKLQEATNWVLRIGSGVLVDDMLHRYGVPGRRMLARVAYRLSVPIVRPKPQAAPAGSTSVGPLAPAKPLPDVIPSGYGLAPLLEGWEVRWLAAHPPHMGEFIWLVFSIDAEPAAYTLSRIYRGERLLEAAIVHCQARERSQALYAWMISETSRYLARKGAQLVRCRTSCPMLEEVLVMIGFVERYRSPVYWWAAGGELPDAPLHLSLLRADDGIRPYPP